jgi:hypothetical protein
MKQRRTLLTAGVFAVLAMIYVPTPRHGYRFIFSQEDTSIAFFQLLLNVGFAALLGAILATIVPNISRRTLFLTAGWIAVVALSVGVFAFLQAAAIRAQSDEKNAEELLVFYATYSQWILTKFRNAATNWRLALRFDEATRVEKRIKELQKHAAQDWRSDPVVDLSGLPDQAPAQAPQASHRRGPTPLPSPDIFDQAAKDLGFVPDPVRQPTPTPEKHISTHPKAGEPNVFDQFDSSTAVPIPRARPVRSPSPR